MKKMVVIVMTLFFLLFPADVIGVKPYEDVSAEVLLAPAAQLPAAPKQGAADNSSIPGGPATYNILGYSVGGKVIYDVVITPPHYDQTMLLTFAIHGFDGAWEHDGAALVQIANSIIHEFSTHPQRLQDTRLIVVPCVNPDGVLNGQSEYGLGRCNGQEIDINRDFDYYWEYSDDPQFRTGPKPFSTPEAVILRDLVLKEKPDIVIDFHGWQNSTLGDDLGKYFNQNFGLRDPAPMEKDIASMRQYFAGWASNYARAVLVEYPNPIKPQNIINWDYAGKTIDAIKAICRD